MSKLFRPKCMRRMAVFMALVAPIVYLFGSLFFALNGAHGGFPFQADYDLPVDSSVIVRNQYLTGGNGFVVNGVTVTASGDSLDIVGTSTGNGGRLEYLYDSYVPLVNGHTYYFNTNAPSGSFPGAVFLSNVNSTSEYVAFYNPGSFISNYSGSFALGINFPLDSSYDLHGIWFNVIDLTLAFGGEIPANYADYFVGFTAYSLGESVYEFVYGTPDNGQYIFNQFFGKDNFLVQWGVDALSESPHGFAPFGYFWKYLDTYVLHLSSNQVGMMAYGYMYYAAHVLLFDVGFILVTFFLTFIQKVADKIGGEDHA